MGLGRAAAGRPGTSGLLRLGLDACLVAGSADTSEHLEAMGDAAETSRAHLDTKTAGQRWRHYRESLSVVRRHHGRLPFKWYAKWPYSVAARGLWHWILSRRA